MDICGHPLVAWSIMQARAAECITRVWVSTDDDEIHDIAIKYGATVIRRPEWMKDSKWTANVPVKGALEVIDDLGWTTATMLTMLPTDPLRMPGDIDRLFDAFCNVKVPDGAIPSGVMAAPVQDISFYKKTGDNTADLEYHDKSGRFVHLTSGMNIMFTQDYWLQQIKISEFYGVENTTDAQHDEAFNTRAKTPDDDLFMIWAESQEWQKYCLDQPWEVEFVRDLMELKILKGRTAQEVYNYE
jgi:hypothetical protein